MTQRGLERPIDPYLTYNSEVNLHLPPARNQRREGARRCLIANAALAFWAGSPSVHYSRDPNFYASPKTWMPAWYSRRNMVEELQILEKGGLVDCIIVAPSWHAEYRSSFSATPELMNRLKFTGIGDLALLDRPPVQLRERKTDRFIQPHAYSASQRKFIRGIAADVDAQNQLLAQTRIELRPGSYPRTNESLTFIGLHTPNPLRCSLRRIYRDNLLLGGRWYGGWWQNIPKRARTSIQINGEPTVEVDFSACQLRLAYGVLGLPDPMEGEVDRSRINLELYDVADVDNRDLAKQAFLIMINAANQMAAERALAKWLNDGGHVSWGDGAFDEAQRVGRAVRAHFSPIEEVFFTDMGLGLQNIDGDICAEIQRAFRSRQCTVLSVHDSFIVPKQHEAELRRVMAAAFLDGMAQAKKRGKLR